MTVGLELMLVLPYEIISNSIVQRGREDWEVAKI